MAAQDRADQHQDRLRPVGQRHRRRRTSLRTLPRSRLRIRSCGSADSAWRSALPLWLRGSIAEAARRGRSRICRSNGISSTGALSASLVHSPAWTPIAVILPLLADRHHDQVERDAAVDRRLAVGLGHQRHRAALLEIADRAFAAALVGRLAGEAEQAEPVGALLARTLDLDSRAGSSRRRRTSAARPRLRDPRWRRRRRASVACIACQSVTAARTSASTWSSSARKRRAGAGVGAVELDVDDRFASVAARPSAIEVALGVAGRP